MTPSGVDKVLDDIDVELHVINYKNLGRVQLILTLGRVLLVPGRRCGKNRVLLTATLTSQFVLYLFSLLLLVGDRRVRQGR